IHADIALEHGPALQRSTGKDIARLTRMNSNPRRVLVKEPCNEIHLRLERFHWLKTLSQFHFRARTFCPPVVRIDSVSHEHRGETLWESRCGTSSFRSPHRNGFEPW